MPYMRYERSPVGALLLTADDVGLSGIWYEGQKGWRICREPEWEERETPVLKQAAAWLDIYFSGREPNFFVPLHLEGTDFQKEVWQLLTRIPYGTTVTYGQIAEQLAKKRGLRRMSAQAVGGAVGRNPVSIMVPCHRVVGSNGSLTGYAGGIEKKVLLLSLEQVDMKKFFLPAP